MNLARNLSTLLIALIASAAAADVSREQKSFEVSDGSEATHSVKCPAGYQVTGGGAYISDASGNFISGSYPTEGEEGWTVTTAAVSNNEKKRKVIVYAICASLMGPAAP